MTVSIGLGLVGSHKMDPWTTLVQDTAMSVTAVCLSAPASQKPKLTSFSIHVTCCPFMAVARFFSYINFHFCG